MRASFLFPDSINTQRVGIPPYANLPANIAQASPKLSLTKQNTRFGLPQLCKNGLVAVATKLMRVSLPL